MPSSLSDIAKESRAVPDAQGQPGDTTVDLSSLDLLERGDLIKMITAMTGSGVVINFYGKRAAAEISRSVRPRVTRRISDLHVGSPEEQSRNLLVEGENLQAMVTLYKYRGQVDLILTDPPYNTGGQFRYNDKWDVDPNDPDLGQVVALEDTSRHTKWMRAMMPRLQMMRAMLKPQGIIAICIDDNELFHLGMMMDEVFGESNRLAIINWQKTTVKNNTKRVATTTEYVLVYAKDIEFSQTRLLSRSEKANARFGNPDNDRGAWKQGDLTGTGANSHPTALYAIQSPFTGELHYPGENRCWAFEKRRMAEWLEAWGARYEERDLGDKRPRALVIKGAPVPRDRGFKVSHPVLARAAAAANRRLASGRWPRLYFGLTGRTKPMAKVYLDEIKAGVVPTTFWVEEEAADPVVLDSVSWMSSETGRSREGLEELDGIVGKGHGFVTVKPLKLFKKIIQIWCPPGGLVLDPYAGSGTSGHAVLELNRELEDNRRFILVEQGRPENGDKYARTLTWTRLKNAITGRRAKSYRSQKAASRKEEPLGGGFEFRVLTSQIDARTVMSMKRDELIDVVITSHWDSSSRGAPNLVRIEDPRFTYLVGKNDRNEGYYIIWRGDGPIGTLNVETYREVLAEGKRAGLRTPYHVYARYEVYQSRNVIFYKIPDKILAHLGLNEASDPFNDQAETVD
jgi:adenine-specific DNA-methyltransferase